MDELQALAHSIAKRLTQRGETLVTVESSAGGLIAAALVAVPGASAYFLGGSVVYTAAARHALLGLPLTLPDGMRSASEPYAILLADTLRGKLQASWALAETGASGPTGNRYGDAAGHTCFAVRGPNNASKTLETGMADRPANMRAFAIAALTLFEQALDASPAAAL
ncbi:MAG TPA: CinA family protein [Bordetella sp.]|nr:CinA family protein [Bordetella sp.]